MAQSSRFPSTHCTFANLATALALALALASGVQAQQQAKPGDPAGTPQAAALHDRQGARLQDTYWKLVVLQGQSVPMLPDQEREVRITLGSENRQVQGFTGCNHLGGRYALQGAELKFDALASTRRMCAPAPNALERGVLDALSATMSYRIRGDQLMLLGRGRVLARFEAVHLR